MWQTASPEQGVDHAGASVFFFVRHADHDRLGHMLMGRTPGVSLNARGRLQAESLARRLAAEQVSGVWSGPLERARETAEPIAAACGGPHATTSALDEIDFGDWTGLAFEALAREPRWTRWNSLRSVERAPAGETMLEVQARVVSLLEELRREGFSRCVLVSHGDVIKAALLHLLGVPVDHLLRLEISPASLSAVALGPHGAQVILLNETPFGVERRLGTMDGPLRHAPTAQ